MVPSDAVAATRVLLVSSRTDVSDHLQDDPGAGEYDLERRTADFVDVDEAANEFSIVLIDLDTTPDGVSLGKSLRAARREVEFITLAGPERERQAVESLKVGAFDYLLWPPNESADLWSLLARLLKKVAPPEQPEFPRAFGRFRLLRMLGSGGMAEVFLAEVPATKTAPARACVIKAMHPHLASNEEFVRMFMDECRISSSLVHPNIVRVTDFGRHGEIPYLVMEYVHGRNLEELQRSINAPFPPAIACWIVAEVCAGLSHAHTKADKDGAPLGIVHRDVNPPNVLVSEEGRVAITDFGIAKAAHRYYETTSGVLKGKFEYMSPEQAHGQAVDHRADLFSAGLILYELLTATRPFLAATPVDTLFLIQECNPKPPSTHEPRLPDAIDDIVMKMLAREPADRYSSAAELEKVLRDFARRASNPGPRDLAAFARSARRSDRELEVTGDYSRPLHDRPTAPVAAPAGVVPRAAVAQEITAPPERRRPAMPLADADTITPASQPVAQLPREDSITGPRIPIAPPPFARPVAVPRARPGEPTILGPARTTKPNTNTNTDTPRAPQTTGVQELEIELALSILDDHSTTSAKQLSPDTNPAVPQIRDDTDVGPRPKLDESTAVNSDALLPSQPPGALPPRDADGTVIRPMGAPPPAIPAREPEKSTISDGIFPSEVKAAESKRRLVRAAAVLGGILLVGAIAIPVAKSLGGGTKEVKPYGTPIVKASPVKTPERVVETPTPQEIETPQVVIETPRATPTQFALATPRATPTVRVLTATPKPSPKPSVAPKGKGTLSIWVDGWATVEIDGKPAGVNAPFVGLSVPAGKHVLVLQNQWARKQVDVTIVPGKETKLSVELR